ncbi:MAG: DUF2752 domain-containing protein [Tannerella sp.]|nr:DUF2752 domain-containing protein [Tannerella sp.]
MVTNLSNNKKINKVKCIVFFILPFALHFVPVDFLNGQHSICLFKNISGMECYGCGITRAVLSVIQFDFMKAYSYNKLVIIVFPMLCYLWGKFWWQYTKKQNFMKCRTI